MIPHRNDACRCHHDACLSIMSDLNNCNGTLPTAITDNFGLLSQILLSESSSLIFLGIHLLRLHMTSALWALHIPTLTFQSVGFLVAMSPNFCSWRLSMFNIINVLLSCSFEVRQVPDLLPEAFPIAPSHMVCPKFNCHVYKLKRSAVGEYICFYFATGVLKRCFHWGVLDVPIKLLWWANQYGSFTQKNRKKVSVHPWTIINMTLVDG